MKIKPDFYFRFFSVTISDEKQILRELLLVCAETFIIYIVLSILT